MLSAATGGLGGGAHSSMALETRDLGGFGFLGGLGSSTLRTGVEERKTPTGSWTRKPTSGLLGWSQLITHAAKLSAGASSQQQHDA